MRSRGLLIHRRRTSFCLYVCCRIKAAHKKQDFEAALYVVMYSLCYEGMNNLPCHTKRHWESDICRLVCFLKCACLVGACEPRRHMFHCPTGASGETSVEKTKKKQMTPIL